MEVVKKLDDKKKRIFKTKQFLIKQKCPKCGSNVLVPTKRLDKGNRAYRCLKCNAYVGAPTQWAWCTLKGRIGKDIFINDCFLCDNYTKWKKCPHFVEKIHHDEERK